MLRPMENHARTRQGRPGQARSVCRHPPRTPLGVEVPATNTAPQLWSSAAPCFYQVHRLMWRIPASGIWTARSMFDLTRRPYDSTIQTGSAVVGGPLSARETRLELTL